MKGRIAESQYLRLLSQPETGKGFQNSVAPFATPAFAVNHIDSTQSALRGVVQKFRQQLFGGIAVETVHIPFVLDSLFAMAQFAHRHAIQSRMHYFGDGDAEYLE